MSDGKRRWGDRRDGRRVRDAKGYYPLMPYLMKNRADAEVYQSIRVDITDTLAYLDGVNEGRPKEERINIFHCVIQAVSKLLYHRPMLNRFISGYRIYQRDDITISFVAKKTLEDDAGETVVTLRAKPEWTAPSVGSATRARVSKDRSANNGITDTIDSLSRLPRPILRMVVWTYKRLDFYGMAPRSMTDGNPGYASVLLVNLGSMKGHSEYHHLNNYGTNSILMTIGTMEKVGERTFIDLGIVADERIADGYYMARSMQMFERMLSDPAILDAKLSEVVPWLR